MPTRPSADLLRQRQGYLGAAMLALIGLALTATAHSFSTTAHDRDVRIALGLILIVTAAPIALLPWRRLPRQAMMLSPLVVLSVTAVLGALTESATQSFPAMAGLSVVYLGLTQPPGTTPLAVPILIADWWLAFPSHPGSVLVRLPLMIIVYVVIGEFISRAQRRSRQEATALRAFALTDPLTQLGNRRSLSAELAKLPVGGLVMFLDLDHFKAFNDRYGHAAGDLALTRFAQVARQGLRGSDLVARFGGEEFVIVIPGVASGQAVFDRIRTAWTDAGGPVTFSAGMAQRLAGEDPELTLERADRALYCAKVNGRDRLECDRAPTDTASRVEDTEPAALGDERFSVQDFLRRRRVQAWEKTPISDKSDALGHLRAFSTDQDCW